MSYYWSLFMNYMNGPQKEQHKIDIYDLDNDQIKHISRERIKNSSNNQINAQSTSTSTNSYIVDYLKSINYNAVLIDTTKTTLDAVEYTALAVYDLAYRTCRSIKGLTNYDNFTTYDKNNISKTDMLCPICFDKDRELVIIPCGHTLCQSCFYMQKINYKYDSCAICRKDMNGHMKIYF